MGSSFLKYVGFYFGVGQSFFLREIIRVLHTENKMSASFSLQSDSKDFNL